MANYFRTVIFSCLEILRLLYMADWK